MSDVAARRPPAIAGAGAEPIAIIGAGCRFPGADGLEAFWRLLHERGNAVRPIQREGLETSRFYDARPRTPGRMMTRWGGFLEDLEQFDADFFGISPREAEKLDPAQRIVLEAAWEACEDAGIDTATLSGKSVGVFVGQWLSDFESRLFADLDGVDFYTTTGSGRYATAGRLSYVLGLTGPSISVDTACSSSLVAVHLACQSLRSGETPLAIAAGVNVILQPHITVAYSQSGMMAPDGRCKFGDADGDGYVRSEGVGVLVLKRLHDALADGDAIHAVIRGSAVNNDGRGSGHLATPSREGQAAMLETAYAHAGVSPAAVDYVEAHGTGTRVGDPVELGAVSDVMAKGRTPRHRGYVGSVKTNVGHTEGAAGMAGLLKCVLAFEHEEIPASLHLHTPNPTIPWAELPFEIPKQSVSWPRGSRPRFAGVSAFGIAGTNAHVVLEEAPAVAPHAVERKERTGPWPLVLSAASRTALRALAGKYADLLSAPEAPPLRDLSASAALNRTALAERAVFVANDRELLVERLRGFAAGDDQAAVAARRADHDGRRRIAFVFPGQGGQWIGMARELLATEPVFAEAVARCDSALPPGTGWTVREQLLAEPDQRSFKLNEIAVVQPVLVVVEIALAELWKSLGVVPDAVVGHSMGEVGAAYFAGALSLQDAMRVICERSRLLQRTSGAGAMAVLELSSDETTKRIAPYGDRLCVAVVNGPRSTVISGNPNAVAEVRADCEREGIFCRAVQVDVASHSPQMDPLVPELRTALKGVRPSPATMALYSTVDAERVDGSTLDATYWGRNLRSTVRFASTLDEMLDDGIDAFIEVSPHPALLVSVAQVADARRETGARQPLSVGSLRRNEPERASLLSSFGGLWAAGHPVDWTRIFERGSYQRVSLPTYPWQRERFWPALAPVGEVHRSKATKTLDDAHRDWVYVSRWMPASAQGADEPRRWILGGDGTRDLQALQTALEKRGAAATIVPVAQVAHALTGARRGGQDIGIAIFVDPNGGQLAWKAVETLRALQNAHTMNVSVPRIWWVTRGTYRVASDKVSSNAAEQGALWGAARVLATEHPDWWGGLVDLESSATPTEAEALATHLTAARDEDQVALRGGARYALRLQRTTAPLSATHSWRADGAYLITGGFGGVAQQIALGIVREGGRRLVLLSRTPLPPRARWSGLAADDPVAERIAFVRELEHAGASVHVIHADVGDETQLRAAIAAYESEGWPPIVGVIHAAAVLENRLIQNMTADAFARAMHAKFYGAVALDRVFDDVDIFVTFSSISALLAPAGMANYAAANSGIDALASARRARGRHGVSIQWGPWEHTGLHRREDVSRGSEDLTRQGIGALPAGDGVRFLAPLLAGTEAVVTVAPIDWGSFATAWRGREPSIFRELLAKASRHVGASRADTFRMRLDSSTAVNRHALLEGFVRTALAEVLRRPVEQLDSARPFGSMGLDSLMALEFRNRLETAIEHSLPATIAWNYPTLAALVSRLETIMADALTASPDEHSAAPQSAAEEEAPLPVATNGGAQQSSGALAIESLLGELSELSDEDAARALRRGT